YSKKSLNHYIYCVLRPSSIVYVMAFGSAIMSRVKREPIRCRVKQSSKRYTLSKSKEFQNLAKNPVESTSSVRDTMAIVPIRHRD
ncbi:hypothetical protein L9F63_007233, partial [Diploptera punctata]